MTKMIRIPAGGKQDHPDSTADDSSLGDVPRVQPIEIRGMRENVSGSTSKRPESTAINDALEDVQLDVQNQRRTSNRLLIANRNDAVGVTSTPQMINGQDMSHHRSSDHKMSTLSDPPNASIMCRLPLNRLESILGLLNNIKKGSENTTTLPEAEAVSDEQVQSNNLSEGMENAQDAPNDNNMAFKVLCLYCERSFSNQKLMIKHTDRIHRIAKDRRSSARVLATPLNGSDVSTCCNFCHKSKALNLASDDLQALFKHLISAHSDRYYACERCTLRFPNEEAREVHMEAFHPSATNGRPKSKAALKAFSYCQTSSSLRSQQTATNAMHSKSLKTGIASIVKESLVEQTELSFGSLDRLAGGSIPASSSMKTEVVAQNLCLRSSLRNAAALAPEKVADNNKSKTKAFKKSERLLRRNSEPMLLSRLGITQHRLPRQSRRLMAAASSSANATLLSSEATSSISSTSSSTAPSLGKYATKKKGLGVPNEEAQSSQNCYNKITKLKTIRSTLNSNSSASNDNLESIELHKTRGSDSLLNGSASVINTGSSCDISSGSNSRGGGIVVHTGLNSWCNTTSSTGGNNSCNGNSTVQTTSSGMFDEDFYEKVTQNVKNNLSCHLDGKLQAPTPNAPCPMSPVAVVPSVRSTVVKSPVLTESKIHEATNLPAISAMFPTLLTIEQYGTEPTPSTSNAAISSLSTTSSVKTKKPITKNSWKWKWDFVKKYTYVNENGRIVKKIKQSTNGLRDLSKLDMWTQLTMRTKHELLQHLRSNAGQPHMPDGSIVEARSTAIAEVGAVLRDEKRAMVEQLDCILDARLLPQIDLEQNDQRIIKIEPVDENETIEGRIPGGGDLCNNEGTETVPLAGGGSSLVPWSDSSNSYHESINTDFLKSLQLMQLNRHDLQTRVVLSGEWARPRCYICYGCGAKFNSLKQVEEHRIFRHPHVHSTFYEIVGRELIEKRLYKHFFVPFMALAMHRLHFMQLSNTDRVVSTSTFSSNPQDTAGYYRINHAAEIKNEDSSSNEATSFSTTTSTSASSYRSSTNSSVATLTDTCPDSMNALTKYTVLANDEEDEANGTRSVMCSKCQKECQNQIVLYAHILHCSNDYVWLQAKKRMKYRRAKRRRGGNRSGINCAPPLLTIPRVAQPQQNTLEKVESTVDDSLSSSVDEKGSLTAGAVSSNISISSNDSYCSSNVSGSSSCSANTSSISTSTNSSLNDKDLSKSNGSPKNEKSPKRKENDSDIVKRLLANLPAKRNSRQINLQTTKQVSKRSVVTEKKAFSSETLAITPKEKNQRGAEKCKATENLSSEVLDEPEVVVQSTIPTAAAVPTGNSTNRIEKITTTSLSLSKREKVSHLTARFLKAKQNFTELPATTNAKRVSVKQKQKGLRKKMETPLGQNAVVTNHKKSIKRSSNLLGHSETNKGKTMEKNKLVGALNRNKMRKWKNNQRQIIKVKTNNGHHRILRSSGKRVLPVSISNRKPSLRLIRSSESREKSKKIVLKNKVRVLSSLKRKDKPLDEKNLTIAESENEIGQDCLKETKLCEDTTELDIASSVEALQQESLEHISSINQHQNADKTKEQLLLETVEHNPGVDLNADENSLIIPSFELQITPNQPVKKPHLKNPPATPVKFNPLNTLPQIPSSELCSSLATAVEYNETSSNKSDKQTIACKGKKKKLTDCIAMLTGKLSERLGVDFFNNEKDSEEANQTKSQSSLSTSDSDATKPNIPTSTVSYDEAHHSKGEDNDQTMVQNPLIHSILPVIASNNIKKSLPLTKFTRSDVQPIPMWSKHCNSDVISLPSKEPPNHVQVIDNTRSLSPVLPIPLTVEKPTMQINLPAEQILDEPLNLSTHGPVGRAGNRLQTKDDGCNLNIVGPQALQESSISSVSSNQLLQRNHFKNEKLVCYQNINHPLDHSANVYSQNTHKVKGASPHKVESGSAKASNAGSGNLSTLKLPPGLIIERVEYKQSRPIIAKEAPSVTIVARQRQVPILPVMSENSATDLTMEATTSVTPVSSLTTQASNLTHFAKPLPNHSTFVPYQSDPNRPKITSYSKYGDANVPSRRSEPTTDKLMPACSSSDLRSGPCGENRISVTITESKTPVLERITDIPNAPQSLDLSMPSEHDKVVSPFCLASRKPLINSGQQARNPQRVTSSSSSSSSIAPSPPVHMTSAVGTGYMGGLVEKISPPMTTLIIPQVPMPPLSSQAAQLTKRARRKSVFVPLPVPSTELPNRDVIAKPVNHLQPPTIPASAPTLSRGSGLNSANLLASMSLSFIAPGLLPVTATPMLGPFDVQRLASVRLPAHLQPPTIPPLKIPDATVSTALLEQLFHPTQSEVLSTGLELKKDLQCGQTKPSSSVQPTRANVYPDESSNFIPFSHPKNSNINGLSKQSEHVPKTNMAMNIRTDEIKPTDTMIKSTHAMNKGIGGRITKRRASVADLQRKALMEQIWNQSILDKMMHEKDTRIISGIENAQKVVETHNPPVDTVLEKPINLRQGARTNHTIGQIITIPATNLDNSSNCASGSNVEKTEQQSMKANKLEEGLLSTKIIPVPEKNNKKITHISPDGDHRLSSTIAAAPRVDEKNQETDKLLEKRIVDCNIQSANIEQPNSKLQTSILNDCTPTLEEEQSAHSNMGKDPSVVNTSMEIIEKLQPVDRVDVAQKDGSASPLDCQVKPSSTKIVRKRRKNELASILSDQLLESFKEVDKSRLEDLKLLHDLTCETPDVKFSLEQIPQLAKRKSNPRLPELLMQDSSKTATSLNTASKKVCNSKKLTKDKESTRAESTTKETAGKPVNEISTNTTPAPNKMKVAQVLEVKEHSIADHGETENPKLNASLDVECSATGTIGVNEKNTAQASVIQNRNEENAPVESIAARKTTRSKTPHSSNNAHRSSSPLTRLSTGGTDLNLHNQQIEENKMQDQTTKPAARGIKTSIEGMQKPIEKIQTPESSPTDGFYTRPNATSLISNTPKRIMSRRKSIFVDCDLSQYVEKEEQKHKTKSSNSSIKDDIMVTSRPGTRSQGHLGLDLVQSLVEATMKPRDPRRRILQKRREEEIIAKENQRQLELENVIPVHVEAQKASTAKQVKIVEANKPEPEEKNVKASERCSVVDAKAKHMEEKQSPAASTGTEKAEPLRRISTRRASVCVRTAMSLNSAQDEFNRKAPTQEITSKEDEHMRDIGNEVKRIYKRRASIFHAPIEIKAQEKEPPQIQNTGALNQSLMSEENSTLLKKKEATLNKSGNRRSKTPGPGDWKRRNTLPLNGTPEPIIESLLMHTTNIESNAPKRRTTKNSQIAETVSKLFNIQEEIMLIDSSRRKPRKVNPPTARTTESSQQETQKPAIDSTNAGVLENESEKCETMCPYDFATGSDKVLGKEMVPSSHLARKSFSFSNDEDESPKAIKKLVENIINNTTNSSNASTDYSDDDNMSLACFAARSNGQNADGQQSTTALFTIPPKSADVYIPERATSVIPDDESTTNTDALDDDMSVTTEIPTSLNTSRMGSRGVRRKRRKSRRQSSKIKRQQVKTQEQHSKPIQSFNCELCRKVFKKQDAYNKHRMTLSHIAKLSEQEYLIAQQNQERRQDYHLEQRNEDFLHNTAMKKDQQCSEIVSETIHTEHLLEVPSAIATVPAGLPMPAQPVIVKSKDQNEQPVKELSQEEKLFYECCSMLKESNSNENEKMNRVTMSLKSDEVLHSDRSSLIHSNEANHTSTSVLSTEVSFIEQNQHRSASVGTGDEATNVTCIRPEEAINEEKSMGLRESASFPAQPCVVPNEAGNVSPQNSIQSFSTSCTSGTNNNANNAKIKTKGALKGYDNFKVSIPMTGLTVMSSNASNTCIGIGKESRLDTLADVALCGDIPKEFGIAEQLNDINSTPVEDKVRFETALLTDHKSDVSSLKLLDMVKTDHKIEPKSNTQSPCTSLESLARAATVNKTGLVKNRESLKKPSGRLATGPYRRRMEKTKSPHTPDDVVPAQCDLSFAYEGGEDVYAFQDSPCDGDLPSTYSSKKNSSTLHNSNTTKNDEPKKQNVKHNAFTIQAVTMEEHEDSQMSSLSFSDRDDFVYGTNTMSEEEEEEEDKNSSFSSSEQTTPKKLTTADVQKKSLIMGRIFKKGGAKDKLKGCSGVRKSLTSVPETTETEAVRVAGALANGSKPTTTVKSAAKDFDKLFDTLKNAAASATEVQKSNESGRDIDLHKDWLSTELVGASKNGTENKQHSESIVNNTNQQERETTNPGTERLRRRRSVHQKNLTETWDSDEFEDFHTDDIMKLIDQTEDDEASDNTSPKKRIHFSSPTEETSKVQLSPSSDNLSNDGPQRKAEPNAEKQSGLRRGVQPLNDKKPSKSDSAVTDDSIRKVMESVILETMGGKGCNINKRKPAAVTMGTNHTVPSHSKALRPTPNSENSGSNCRLPIVSTDDVSLALELTSLEEHTLESSVVISSKTITSKFKQKLNSSLRHSPIESMSMISTVETEGDPNARKLNAPNKPCPGTAVVSDSNIKSFPANNNNNNNTNTNNNNDSNSKVTTKSSKITKSKFKPKSTEDVWTTGKTTSVSAGKQRKSAPKKMKNIAYDPDSDYEQSIKCKKVKRKLLENDIEANLKIEQLHSTLINSDDNSILLTTSRRKRNAGDMLYYWSSSSDEELEMGAKTNGGRTKGQDATTKSYDRRRHCKPMNENSPIGKKRGRKKKQSESTKSIEMEDNGSDDVIAKDASVPVVRPLTPAKRSKTLVAATPISKASGIMRKKQQLPKVDHEKSLPAQQIPTQIVEETSSTSSEQLQQHGWIMGDSHKKLVTMLAHAKGKHDSRKLTNNRKK